MKGYIYILKRFGERFLKIGKTTKDPEIRAAELSPKLEFQPFYSAEEFLL